MAVKGRKLFLILSFSAISAWVLFYDSPRYECANISERSVPQLYNYEVVKEYPHDAAAFTQGLIFDRECDANGQNCQDVFFESTGNYGKSQVRSVSAATGDVIRHTKLSSKFFGEGIVRRGDLLYQITWLKSRGFVYSARDLRRVGKFNTPLGDGWGITNDGDLLVISDGTNVLTWVDPDDGFSFVKSVGARDGAREVHHLNELEMIDGEIWANVWMTECIARICPVTGRVTGWVLLDGIGDAPRERSVAQANQMDVLNGIAWDPQQRRLFVTGKYWPSLFEVRAVPAVRNKRTLRSLQSCYISAEERLLG